VAENPRSQPGPCAARRHAVGPSSSWISDGVETPRAGGLLGAGEALKTRIGRAAAAFILLALGHAAAADEPAIRTGAKIYENNCSNCHGDDLQNNSSIAFDLRPAQDRRAFPLRQFGAARQERNAVVGRVHLPWIRSRTSGPISAPMRASRI